jgi:hypothetical protein
MREATRTRHAALAIALLAMAGLAVPAIVSASIRPPTALEAYDPQAKPSERPTPKPKPTPVPTAPPTATPVPVPTAAPTPTPAPAPARTATPRSTPAPPATATIVPVAPSNTPAEQGSAFPTGSTDPGGVIGGLDGEGSGDTPTSGFGGWPTDVLAPVGYAAAVLLVALVIARRRLERRHRATLVATAPDPDSLPVQRFDLDPSLRPVVADDEENIPRWLRPSVRAERFGIQEPRTRTWPAAFRPANPGAAPMTSDPPLDLEALFAAKRDRAAAPEPAPDRDVTRE